MNDHHPSDKANQRPTLLDGFDDTVNLWSIDKPGHTAPVAQLERVHSGVDAANRLLVAAQMDQLELLPVAQILQALQELQYIEPGEKFGCFRWYFEESTPVDTNASFFIGLPLIALAYCYTEKLDARSQSSLNQMLKHLSPWFDKEIEEGAAFYPNKYLGDLVCGWLLSEYFSDAASCASILPPMQQAADYWKESHWGWGEHLSKEYTPILLCELSALLLLSKSLTPAVRTSYLHLFQNLVNLDDLFDGGARVPSIRTYAFNGFDPVASYRTRVTAWSSDNPSQVYYKQHLPFGHLFNQLGWHAIAPKIATGSGEIKIPCDGGAQATVWFFRNARVGSLSQFPIMPGTDHQAWGLSWQSMPMAFACGEDGWGFLRWQTVENGVERCHPAKDKGAAYLKNSLTDVVAPPIVGQSFSQQCGGEVITLRRMPQLSRQWARLADQLVLHGKAFEALESKSTEAYHQLRVRADDTQVTFYYFPLVGQCQALLKQDAFRTEWEMVWEKQALEQCEQLAGLWFAFWGENTVEPVLTPCPPSLQSNPTGMKTSIWKLEWPLRSNVKSLRIEPLNANPLQSI